MSSLLTIDPPKKETGHVDDSRMPVTFLRAEPMGPLEVCDQPNADFLCEVDTFNAASGDGDTQ